MLVIVHLVVCSMCVVLIVCIVCIVHAHNIHAQHPYALFTHSQLPPTYPPTQPHLRNVETLQSQLDGAESRATQLASRLTSAQAHAAEAQTLGEELQRWRDLAAQLLPHGSGVGDVGGGPGGVGGGARGEGGGGGDVRGGGATPEMLQSVMVELQKDVRQRAAASVQAQQACADLQGAVMVVGWGWVIAVSSVCICLHLPYDMLLQHTHAYTISQPECTPTHMHTPYPHLCTQASLQQLKAAHRMHMQHKSASSCRLTR